MGIQVAVCGEAAGDAMMIPLLLAFGVDELSVSASLVPEVRKVVCGLDISKLVSRLDDILGMNTRQDISEELNRITDEDISLLRRE